MQVCSCTCTEPQHLVCRVVQSRHTNHMQMSIVEVFICRRLHMNTSMIPVCIWLICRLCTALHTKCCGAVMYMRCEYSVRNKSPKSLQVVQAQTECVCVCACMCVSCVCAQACTFMHMYTLCLLSESPNASRIQ